MNTRVSYEFCFHHNSYLTWDQLYTVVLNNEKLFFMFCSGFEEERPEVPMLFRDVPSLLIIFVLTMPQPLRKGTVPMSASHDTTREEGVSQGPLHKDSPIIGCNQGLSARKERFTSLIYTAIAVIWLWGSERLDPGDGRAAPPSRALLLCFAAPLEKVEGHLRPGPTHGGHV